jgi:hypothetical protein
MLLQHMVWTDERVVVRHGGLEKVDPTRPDGAGGAVPVSSGVHNSV